jgi:hypothetical protein
MAYEQGKYLNSKFRAIPTTGALFYALQEIAMRSLNSNDNEIIVPESPIQTSTPIIYSGLGFEGPTEQPSAVGDPEDWGYDANAIARWNFVPYQILGGTFNVGVVAHHFRGISHIDFSLNGGTWESVSGVSYNSDSKTVEYFATVDTTGMSNYHPASSDYAEIRAIVYPNVGVPLVLGGTLPSFGTYDSIADSDGIHGMFFLSDAGQTYPVVEKFVSVQGSDSNDGSEENPVLTIAKASKLISNEYFSLMGTTFVDGGIVRLMSLPEGVTIGHTYANYTFGNFVHTKYSWLTVAPQEGIESSSAPITQKSTDTGGARVTKIKLDNVTVAPYAGAMASNTILYTATQPNTTEYAMLWVNDCQFNGMGRLTSGNWTNGFRLQWVTHCGLTGSLNGFVDTEIARGCTVGIISGDAYSKGGLVIDSMADVLDFSGTGNHPDFYQFDAGGASKSFKNRILQNLYNADSTQDFQGIFAGVGAGVVDCAIIGVTIDKSTGVGDDQNVVTFGATATNVYIKGCSFNGPGVVWRTEFLAGRTYSNVVVEDSYIRGDSFLNDLGTPPLGVTYI